MREDFRPGEGDVDLVEVLQELLGTEVDLVMTGAVKNRCIPATSSAPRSCSVLCDTAVCLADTVDVCDAVGEATASSRVATPAPPPAPHARIKPGRRSVAAWRFRGARRLVAMRQADQR